MLSSQVQHSHTNGQKTPSPKPFKEPEGMMTIELNKNGYGADERVNKNHVTQTKYILNKGQIYKLVLAIIIFLVLGLFCMITFMLIENRVYFHSQNNLITPDHIKMCKTLQNSQECCSIFVKKGLVNDIELCTIEKVLDIILQYEIKTNKRHKREEYFNPDFFYGKATNDYHYNENYQPENDVVYEQQVPDYLPSGSPHYVNEEESLIQYSPHNHFQQQYSEYIPQEYAPSEHPNYPQFDELNEYPRESINSEILDDMQSQQQNHLIENLQEISEKNQERNKTIIPAAKSTTENIVLSSIQKINNNATFNNTDINKNIDVKSSNNEEDKKTNCKSKNCTSSILKSSSENKSKVDTERISQGTDFNVKTKIDNFPTGGSDGQVSQLKQVMGPCYYPYPTPFATPYRVSMGIDGNPVFSAMQTPNVQTSQPMFVINPQMYPYIPINFHNNFQNQQMMNAFYLQNGVKPNQMQFSNPSGQFYSCNPVNPPANLVTVPGVEVRNKKEPWNLQDLLKSEQFFDNNTTREAMDCPDGLKGCADGSKCLIINRFCDNEVDCNDASDEMFCSCRDRVGPLRQCDGYMDCPNGEDEDECFDCAIDEFSCDDWSRVRRGTCVPLHQRCDGIKQCDLTGKDEEDCSILTDHLGQHELRQVSNAAGFLHRNFKGVWYPACFGGQFFSLEVCRTESGPSEIVPKTNLMHSDEIYKGLYVNTGANNQITLSSQCVENRAVFVECPPLFCGLRMTILNPFRTSEVDTSSEDFLNQVERISHAANKSRGAILGSARVVGGKASQPGAWPWVVSIYKNGIFHCGGVLINELWIVTAAHCVDKYWFFYYEVQAGMLRRFSYSPMEQSRWATIAIPHQEYDKHSLKNDIALMKLSSPVRYNRYVRPICLPSEHTAGKDYLQGPAANTICTTVGWGATIEKGTDPDHMREVEVPILGHCKHLEDEQGDEICAGLVEGGRDACQGDSGGPLMCKNVNNPSQWYLAGIVSHGEGCARPNEPGVYTKVANYLGWIAENMRDDKFVNTVPLQQCPGFICRGTKTCLPKKRHCDKIVDCLFGDDEINCWRRDRPEVNQVLGQSLDDNKLIDKILDIFSLNKRKSTKPVENSLKPVPKSTEKFFNCKIMLQKIPIEQKCDRNVDCEDGTDEDNCLCVDYLMHKHQEAICDGVTDCKDLSDEVDCVKCLPTQYLCRINQRCIPLESRCDTIIDCLNGEDEWDCVALTNGQTLELDGDLRPKQSMKGIITINRSGVWRPLCTNISTDAAAAMATNVCNLLGFEEYTTFHKLPIAVPNGDKPLTVTIGGFKPSHSSWNVAINTTTTNSTTCANGLFVNCLNVSLTDTIHDLFRDNVTSRVELYTVPWNAVIYFNGQFKCMGTIINTHWILAAASCFQLSISAIKAGNIGVLLGKGKAHLDVEGPHELSLPITEISVLNGHDVMLLKTDEKIRFNRYMKPAPLMTNINFSNEKCVAIGVEHDRSQLVFLKSLDNCLNGFRCFEAMHETESCAQNWTGVITCDAKRGWYPAAVFTNFTGCEFAKNNNKFLDISALKTDIEFAMGDETEHVVGSCAGFRCHLGQCLRENQICNGISDCRNGEDEDLNLCGNLTQPCPLNEDCTKLPYCNQSQMRCKNGKCVPKTVFCDLVNDCGDFSDEPPICSCKKYLELSHPERLCDGIVHCEDKSDEDPLMCPCTSNNFKCGTDNLCVPKEMVCDGVKDCPNGRDESICLSLRTSFANPNSGEVIERTAGVWHSGCFSRNLTTTQLEEICEQLGFAGGSAQRLPTPPEKNHTTAVELDIFPIVWIRRRYNKLKLQLRTGYKPLTNLIDNPNDDCFNLFIRCL